MSVRRQVPLAALCVLGALGAVSMAAPGLAAQGGRGARQGGPGGGANVRICVNPNMTAAVQITKGPPTQQQFGVDPANGVIVIRPNGDAAQYMQPCSNFPPGADDPLARYLFPPDLVLGHDQAINLTDVQRTALRTRMLTTQQKLLGYQSQLTGEVEKLQRLLQPAAPDESKVLEQIDRVLSVERDIKREQLGLMVFVKSHLSAEQQAMLAQFRASGGQE